MMKNNIKYVLSLLKAINIKVIIFVIVVLCIFAPDPITKELNFWSALVRVYSFSYFNLVLIFVLLFNSYNIYTKLSTNYNFLSRYSGKKEFLNKYFKFVTLSNLIIFLFLFLIVIFIALIKTKFYIVPEMHNIYNIYDFVYTIFYLVRFFIIIDLFVIFMILLYNIFSKVMSVLLVVFTIYTALTSNVYFVVDGILDIPLNYYDYFGYIESSSFIFEVSFSLFYIFLFLSIISGIINIYIRYMRDQND